ncbi:MAG: hydantoinase B/oxoprolinase family protein, partial [Leptolyngbya sp. SIO1D8]|nr:hydantoinase B/oxoprolinase family protein [Leptolyngbya sp. SIO1D8]
CYGGRYGKDGMDGVDTLYANTRNNPIEDIEAHLPLRVTRYELIEDASGAGKYRGGLGSIRDIQFLSPGQMSLEGEGNKYAPWGIFGGNDGTPGGVQILNSETADTLQDLPSKFPCRKTKPGDTLRTISPCGGGYGNPLERDPVLVQEDVLDEFMSLESAKRDYGVVIDPETLAIDETATVALRKTMGK